MHNAPYQLLRHGDVYRLELLSFVLFGRVRSSHITLSSGSLELPKHVISSLGLTWREPFSSSRALEEPGVKSRTLFIPLLTVLPDETDRVLVGTKLLDTSLRVSNSEPWTCEPGWLSAYKGLSVRDNAISAERLAPPVLAETPLSVETRLMAWDTFRVGRESAKSVAAGTVVGGSAFRRCDGLLISFRDLTVWDNKS